MNEQHFSLQPFPASSPLPAIEIAGQIARHSNTLAIDYQLYGAVAEVAIAPPSISPTRQHELWQETCFEFFLASPDSPQYWEFNLSPAGDWNVYRFDSYRQGMQEETNVESLPFNVRRRADALILELKLDLNSIAPAQTEFQVAICSVIKTKKGEISYWALTHRDLPADFHRRDSFAIALPG